MKNTVVLFTPNNARVLVNPPDLSIYSGRKDCIINPGLDLVKKIDPHFWKLSNGSVVPMNEAEKMEREKLLIKQDFSMKPEIQKIEVQVEKIVEVLREVRIEVPVEVIKYVEIVKEVPRDIRVEVVKEVEVVREVSVEVIKYVDVFKDKLVEIVKEIPINVEIVKLVHKVPSWVLPALLAQMAIIIVLLVK